MVLPLACAAGASLQGLGMREPNRMQWRQNVIASGLDRDWESFQKHDIHNTIPCFLNRKHHPNHFSHLFAYLAAFPWCQVAPRVLAEGLEP